MITFILNSDEVVYTGPGDLDLLTYLREEKGITSVKDGCSGQAACGACMVEIDGKARLSCSIKMSTLNQKHVVTMEGIPAGVKEVIARAFVEKGAVQCGFCTPGFIMRTKILFAENPNPTRNEIINALHLNLCRCTGYQKIIDAIVAASERMYSNAIEGLFRSEIKKSSWQPKYEAYDYASGQALFVNDMKTEGMLHAALRFSDHPRARVISIDTVEAEKLPGVRRIFTAKDIPGNPMTGLIIRDWPLMIAEGQVTGYIGDVVAGVVADNVRIAREAASLIRVNYEIYEPVTDPFLAMGPDAPKVHAGINNLLETCRIKRGNPEDAFKDAAFVAGGIFETQRVEHGFLETESALAMPEHDGIRLYSQGQGVYVDRRQIAGLLNLPEEKIRITQVPTGGGFGGKEDLTVQGHACLFAWLTRQPVKLTLRREESIRMHPKRHPVWMNMKIACDAEGKLTALKLDAVGDTGAYASVGTKVMERVAGHASGAYHIPEVDIESKTVYTNNIPSGAMRGFGVNQVTFALESLIDKLCEKGNFDRWQFRYDNALTEGLMTATGQVLGKGVGVRKTLEAVREEFYNSTYAGLACGIKNSGVGNGMHDESFVKIRVAGKNKIVISHGWSEMGQGIHTMAIQIFCKETGIDPEWVEVIVDTADEIITGMTTSSRATTLLGNAIIDASRLLKSDLMSKTIEELQGKIYTGKFVCDWTTKPGTTTEKIITHYAYGYATQLVILGENGEIDKVIASHDVGKVINPILFEGQIEGAVHMGLGYALSEDLPMREGRLVSDKLRDCGILRAGEMPEVIVKAVEVPDDVGPYGAKGIGEIGLVPTAAAVANAFYQYNGIRNYKLPLKKLR